MDVVHVAELHSLRRNESYTLNPRAPDCDASNPTTIREISPAYIHDVAPKFKQQT